MQIRTFHAYIGMLIAPSVIFFASTGFLQIFSLHEDHPGYAPPRFIEMLSAVHKDQRFAVGHGRPSGQKRSAASISPPPRKGEADDKAQGAHTATNLLKAFFASVAVGLIVSTALGVWMALQQIRRRPIYLVLLVVGTCVPLLLAALTS